MLTVSPVSIRILFGCLAVVSLADPQGAVAYEMGTAGSSIVGAGDSEDSAMPARRALISDEAHAFQWGLHIDSDVVANLQGGIKRGAVANNVIHAAVAVDTKKLGAWDGGRFVASAIRIAGNQASDKYIGDLQVVDNLEATAHSRLYQFWYRQQFRLGRQGANYNVRGGLIDLNENFASVDTASLLLNSSFGVDPTLSVNLPLSIYPQPGLGIEASGQWPQWQWQFGVFQANPERRSDGFSYGNLLIGEVDYLSSAREDAATILKIGLWRYRQSDPTLSSYPERNWGVYASIETPISHGPKASRVFVQLGHAPDAANSVPNYLGLGFQLPSPLSGRKNDRFTAGIAHAEINNSSAGSETSFELSYQISLHRYVALQPDLQYIRHPGGRSDIENALVAIVRLHLEFY